MTEDDYVFVQVMFHGSTPKAVRVSSITLAGDEVWVPRSALHGADDVKVSGLRAEQEIELRVRRWAAEEKGLA